MTPSCEMGYTEGDIANLLGDRAADFWDWHHGQGYPICDGRRWDPDTGAHYPTGCGPHGPVVYHHDVDRFMGMRSRLAG